MSRTQMWTLNKGQDDEVRVYGDVNNWNFWHETPVTDELNPCTLVTTKNTAEVKSHTRKRYPDDQVGITIKAHPRIVLDGAKYTSGNALPGKVVFYATDPETWDGGDEERAFMYVGDFKHLFLFSQGDASKDIYITNASGAKYHICEETADPTTLGAGGTDRIR